MPTDHALSRLGLLLLFAATLTACAGPAATQRDASSTNELEALYWARQDSARMAFSTEEVAFMTGMIGHHAQALIMSRLAPENDASPAVRRLAARIINAQNDEIASMQRWLRDREQPVPNVHIDGLMLHINLIGPDGEPVAAEMDHSSMGHGSHGGGMDHAMMPGMLTQAQLEELAAARGRDFDRLFLTYMIQHHQGAVTMVDDLFATDGAGQDEAAFKLAADIHVDQITEIERMKLMLSTLM